MSLWWLLKHTVKTLFLPILLLSVWTPLSYGSDTDEAEARLKLLLLLRDRDRTEVPERDTTTDRSVPTPTSSPLSVLYRGESSVAGYHLELGQDGVHYWWVIDGQEFAHNSSKGVTLSQRSPFESENTIPTTGATPAATSLRPEPGRGSFAGTIRTAPIITLAPGVGTPGNTDCPPSG